MLGVSQRRSGAGYLPSALELRGKDYREEVGNEGQNLFVTEMKTQSS